MYNNVNYTKYETCTVPASQTANYNYMYYMQFQQYIFLTYGVDVILNVNKSYFL